jgi:hypothetical protein
MYIEMYIENVKKAPRVIGFSGLLLFGMGELLAPFD